MSSRQDQHRGDHTRRDFPVLEDHGTAPQQRSRWEARRRRVRPISSSKPIRSCRLRTTAVRVRDEGNRRHIPGRMFRRELRREWRHVHAEHESAHDFVDQAIRMSRLHFVPVTAQGPGAFVGRFTKSRGGASSTTDDYCIPHGRSPSRGRSSWWRKCKAGSRKGPA
jgi:hypothetical protein